MSTRSVCLAAMLIGATCGGRIAGENDGPIAGDGGYDAQTGIPWYPDGDGDGYGDSDSPAEYGDVAPEGMVGNNLDCDDGDSTVNPEALEICGDGIDNDCNDPGEHPGLGVPGDAWCACPSPEGSAVPKSLFIQMHTVGGFSDEEVHGWFSHICECHRDAAKGDYIANLVLQDIAHGTGDSAHPDYGELFKAGAHSSNHKLDIVDDYFGCFDNLFVGTVDIPHAAKYTDGILDSDFRWQNINVSTAVMDAFIAAYPLQPFHWYITYEANLNYFTTTNIKEAYLAYNLEMVNRFRARRPSAAILWSPTFWTRFASVTSDARNTLIANLEDHFERIESESAQGEGINWLHFQDHVGVRCGNFTTSDVSNYFSGVLGALSYSFDSLRVNMEYFEIPCGGSIGAGNPTEIQTRQLEYEQLGIPIGASWEIRFWDSVHLDI